MARCEATSRRDPPGQTTHVPDKVIDALRARERDGAIDMPKPGAPLPPPERLTPEQQGYWHAICPDLPPGHHASSKFVGLHLKKHVDGPVKHGAETLILRRYWDGRANQARFWVKPAAPRGW